MNYIKVKRRQVVNSRYGESDAVECWDKVEHCNPQLLKWPGRSAAEDELAPYYEDSGWDNSRAAMFGEFSDNEIAAMLIEQRIVHHQEYDYDRPPNGCSTDEHASWEVEAVIDYFNLHLLQFSRCNVNKFRGVKLPRVACAYFWAILPTEIEIFNDNIAMGDLGLISVLQGVVGVVGREGDRYLVKSGDRLKAFPAMDHRSAVQDLFGDLKRAKTPGLLPSWE